MLEHLLLPSRKQTHDDSGIGIGKRMNKLMMTLALVLVGGCSDIWTVRGTWGREEVRGRRVRRYKKSC